MGLLNLESANELIAKRKEQWDFYRKEIDGSDLRTIQLREEEGFNGAYFPVIFPDKSSLEVAVKKGLERGIELRKYFNPSLNRLDYVSPQRCPVSEDISERICCLPLYHELNDENQGEVLDLILSV
jgi:dTDP-4-amino-4,6-dideoxygalactose transaminase